MGGLINTAAKCLTNVPSNSAIESNYAKFYLPGQIWDVEQQCQYAFNTLNTSAIACGVINLPFLINSIL